MTTYTTPTTLLQARDSVVSEAETHAYSQHRVNRALFKLVLACYDDGPRDLPPAQRNKLLRELFSPIVGVYQSQGLSGAVVKHARAVASGFLQGDPLATQALWDAGGREHATLHGVYRALRKLRQAEKSPSEPPVAPRNESPETAATPPETTATPLERALFCLNFVYSYAVASKNEELRLATLRAKGHLPEGKNKGPNKEPESLCN